MIEGEFPKVSENISETPISGFYIIERPKYPDNRGYFNEVIRMDELEGVIRKKFEIKQWSHSYSFPGVIRALHCEEQDKLCYPMGKMFGAYADVREKSETFGTVLTINYDVENTRAVYIPRGVANSICVTGEEAIHFMYLINEYYDPKKIKGIAWNDPDLAIDWPIPNPVISERDRNNPTMRELFPERYR